jgi:hypothetical protein
MTNLERVIRALEWYHEHISNERLYHIETVLDWDDDVVLLETACIMTGCVDLTDAVLAAHCYLKDARGRYGRIGVVPDAALRWPEKGSLAAEMLALGIAAGGIRARVESAES